MTDIQRIEGSLLHDSEWHIVQKQGSTLVPLDLSSYSDPTITVWAEDATTLSFTKTSGITLNASPTLETDTNPVATVSISWLTADLGSLIAVGGVYTKYVGLFTATLSTKPFKQKFSLAIDDSGPAT